MTVKVMFAIIYQLLINTGELELPYQNQVANFQNSIVFFLFSFSGVTGKHKASISALTNTFLSFAPEISVSVQCRHFFFGSSSGITLT